MYIKMSTTLCSSSGTSSKWAGSSREGCCRGGTEAACHSPSVPLFLLLSSRGCLRGETDAPAHFDLHSLPLVGSSCSRVSSSGALQRNRSNSQREVENVDQNEDGPLFLLWSFLKMSRKLERQMLKRRSRGSC